jgi:hypothetical protein
MPKPTSEDDKKHGDRFESLIDRTMRDASRRKRSADANADDPTGLQDNDDEDLQNDDPENRRDVGERD